jgi:hypothetical protein
MFRKSLLTATLALPLVAMAGTAFAGPTTSYPPARSAWQSTGPYAQYVQPAHSDGTQCRYSGGPKSPVWHQMRH